MCGRFVLTSSGQELAEAFGVPAPDLFTPRYNIAPTQEVFAVRAGESGRELARLRWGLVPSWSKDAKGGGRLINARAETADQMPSFRSAFKRRRCLIAADGFYEWKALEGRKTKQPYFISLKSGGPFAFAGLWEVWHRDEENLQTCTILTTAPNDLMRSLHDRMPVILPAKEYDLWLDPTIQDPEQLRPLLRPYPAKAMAAYAVSTLVNSPRNDNPDCILPAEPPKGD
jgi:putative SOS response-associated peptidase YedK